MDTKLQILKNTFQNRFSVENFIKFSTEFFGNIKMVNPDRENTSIPTEYFNTVKTYRHIATYTTQNQVLDIFAVNLKSDKSIERSRGLQRSFISKLLSRSNHDGAIVAFYTDYDPRWRLSFVRLDYEFAAGRVKMSLTPAKRYSYLVGEKEPCHTAMQQLYPIFRDEEYNPTLNKIEEAFSVESVTKDFFEKYKEKYFVLKEHLDGNEAFNEQAVKYGFTSEQFAKKLMGQLAFLYFLQKKGWLGIKVLPHSLTEKAYRNAYYKSSNAKNVIPKIYKQVGEDEYRLVTDVLKSLNDEDSDIAAGCFQSEPWGSGERKFVRHLFEKSKGNFFDNYLEPLFYKALNKKRGNNNFFNLFNCKIPFLNGGLFDPIEGYEWDRTEFNIPNDLFSNVEIKGEHEADGILDIFDRYNFTMNEDEPLEREVAVDPEMLGKIFENLLDTKDRKSKGAFYTPREIVHYMCAESLINYLVGKTTVPYDEMKAFILDGEFMKDEDYTRIEGKRRLPQTVYDNLRIIDKALENIKVADPAVGSGAFPLGMLSEIVKARNNITYYYASALNNSADKARMFEQRDPYRLKWDTIQNCIFAVDIEASAVDIAKLRLWLSLVVDEDLTPSYDEIRYGDTKQKDPRPLPNLDYNIMCGNSLIDEFDGIQLFDDSLLVKNDFNTIGMTNKTLQISLFVDSIELYLDDLRKEQERLFSEQNPDNKKSIKKRIDKIIDDIIKAKLTKDNNTEGFVKYEVSLKEKTKPYFLWKLEFAKVFRENGGFDLVIGNPPYVGESGHKEIFRPIAATSFGKRFYKGKMDLFYFFFHKGLDILTSEGEISLITTNYFTTAMGAKKLRTDFKDRTQIRRLINFNEVRVFETALGQHNMITMATKKCDITLNCEFVMCTERKIAKADELKKILYGNDPSVAYGSINQSELYDGKENYIRFAISSDEKTSLTIESVLSKIKCSEKTLGDLCDINQGVVTGCDTVSNKNSLKLPNKTSKVKNDGIYVFDLKNPRDNKIVDELTFGKQLLKDFYKNSDISRFWSSDLPTKKLIYFKDGLDHHKYPDLFEHLYNFKPILEERLKTYNERYHWTALHRPRNEKVFEAIPKLVAPYRSKINTFAYNEVEWFCRSDVYVITTKNDYISLKYLLGLLNSRLYYIWLYYRGKRKGEILELFQIPLCEIPIKSVDKFEQEKVIAIVEEIILAKQYDHTTDTTDLETKIDHILYEIYGLTEEEIKILEHDLK